MTIPGDRNPLQIGKVDKAQVRPLIEGGLFDFRGAEIVVGAI
jgi:hypothetical protein